MNVSREEKKAEAIRRMMKMNIWRQAVSAFKEYDTIFTTEPPIGAVYTLDKKLQKEVENFEKEHDALVYIVVRAYTNFGMMDSLLFVSDYPEEWEMDNEDLEDRIAMTYTINWDMPECSEMGSISVLPTPAGGLVRQC